MANRFFNPQYNTQFVDWAQKKPVEILGQVAMMKAKNDALAPYARKFFDDASAQAITFGSQQENLDNLIQPYDEEVNRLTESIINSKTPGDRTRAINDLAALKRNFTSDVLKGDIAKYTNNFRKYQEVDKELKDHSLRDKFREAVLSQVNSDTPLHEMENFSIPELSPAFTAKQSKEALDMFSEDLYKEKVETNLKPLLAKNDDEKAYYESIGRTVDEQGYVYDKNGKRLNEYVGGILPTGIDFQYKDQTMTEEYYRGTLRANDLTNYLLNTHEFTSNITDELKLDMIINEDRYFQDENGELMVNLGDGKSMSYNEYANEYLKEKAGQKAYSLTGADKLLSRTYDDEYITDQANLFARKEQIRFNYDAALENIKQENRLDLLYAKQDELLNSGKPIVSDIELSPFSNLGENTNVTSLFEENSNASPLTRDLTKRAIFSVLDTALEYNKIDDIQYTQMIAYSEYLHKNGLKHSKDNMKKFAVEKGMYEPLEFTDLAVLIATTQKFSPYSTAADNAIKETIEKLKQANVGTFGFDFSSRQYDNIMNTNSQTVKQTLPSIAKASSVTIAVDEEQREKVREFLSSVSELNRVENLDNNRGWIESLFKGRETAQDVLSDGVPVGFSYRNNYNNITKEHEGQPEIIVTVQDSDGNTNNLLIPFDVGLQVFEKYKDRYPEVASALNFGYQQFSPYVMRHVDNVNSKRPKQIQNKKYAFEIDKNGKVHFDEDAEIIETPDGYYYTTKEVLEAIGFDASMDLELTTESKTHQATQSMSNYINKIEEFVDKEGYQFINFN